jgi:hypothetical protein
MNRKPAETEKPTQHYQGSEQEIEGIIQQLNTMSLNDPTYGHLYFKVMKLDTSGIAKKCISPEPLHVSQPQVTYGCHKQTFTSIPEFSSHLSQQYS